MAGSKRPQREPTRVISLTITGAVLAHRHGGAQAFRRAGGVHHPTIGALGQFLRQELGGHASLLNQPHLVPMTAEQVHARAMGLQDLGDEQP